MKFANNEKIDMFYYTSIIIYGASGENARRTKMI